MKDVQLAGPAWIDGILRHPAEGTITVSDDTAQRLAAANHLAPEDGDDDDDGLDDLTVAKLKELAVENAVDLGTATSKADIIAAMRAHAAAAQQ